MSHQSMFVQSILSESHWANFVSFCNQFYLAKLPFHIDTLVFTTLACFGLQLLSKLVSPYVSRHYTRLHSSKRLDWDIRVVSMVHAVLISWLAYANLNNPVLIKDKVFGYTFKSGEIYAISCGYFLYDIIITLVNLQMFGYSFLIHAVSCFLVFIFSYMPFLHYYGSIFLLYELSTPFLNISWWCDKTGRSGGIIQILASIALVLTFFFVRLVFGLSSSVDFYRSIVTTPGIPIFHVSLYSFSNVVLNGLNILWFVFLVMSVYKRLAPGKPVKRTKSETVTEADGEAHENEDEGNQVEKEESEQEEVEEEQVEKEEIAKKED